MNKIYFLSDLHFNHNKEFIYTPRDFGSCWAMNDAIVSNWNSIVDEEDDVYLLGDIMLGDNDAGIKLLNQLRGKIHIAFGNHDTDNRLELYGHCHNVVEIAMGYRFKYKGLTFWATHHPMLVANMDEAGFSHHAFNLFGHTHSKEKFYNDNPWMYNVACDAQDCTPVDLDDIIEQCKCQYEDCARYL